MADRTSAEIFAIMFDGLAKLARRFEKDAGEPCRKTAGDRLIDLANKLWKRRVEFDFSDCQMECDESLAALGLAKLNQPDPDDEGERRTLYKGVDF